MIYALSVGEILRGLWGMINGLIIITTTLVAIPIIYYFVDRIVTNKRIKENQIA